LSSSRRITTPVTISASCNVRGGKVVAATPYLEQAQRINPASYDNGYDLALAYITTSRLADARQLLQNLLKQKDSAELHNLLGEVEEEDGNSLLPPTNTNWPRTSIPARAIFSIGVASCCCTAPRSGHPGLPTPPSATPNSPRLAIGLGIAYYSRWQLRRRRKISAQGRGPRSRRPRVYPFLSRAYDSSPSQADESSRGFAVSRSSSPATAARSITTP